MKQVRRLDLSDSAHASLRERAAKIDLSAEKVRMATALWSSFRGPGRDEVRILLREMASGLERCMYCEDGHGTDIEHFRPKAIYPESAFAWDNYLLACSECNSNYKRSEFPLDDGIPLLIDPSLEDPVLHLALSPSTGQFRGKTKKGEESIRVFGLNRQVCALGRLRTFTVYAALINEYARARDLRKMEAAELILRALEDHPFQSVRTYMATQASVRSGQLAEEVRDNILRFPEVIGQAPARDGVRTKT